MNHSLVSGQQTPPHHPSPAVAEGFRKALFEASRFLGATAPNPPVGAAALDERGEVLAVAAHARAGEEHAEAKLLRLLEEQALLSKIETLIVTLEPCNHFGRTPPCSQAILRHPNIRKVWVGSTDPNETVKGGGILELKKAGLEVQVLESGSELSEACARLIAPFALWIRTKLPYIILKSAHRFQNATERQLAFVNRGSFFRDFSPLAHSMTPEPGYKTFTSVESLRLAHEMRKTSDAIITGVGTVLADLPLFNVRYVPDHPGKARQLLVLDRQKRTPRDWIMRAHHLGFQVKQISTDQALTASLHALGNSGAHEVLVEGGPRVLQYFLKNMNYQEHISFWSTPGEPDLIQRDRLPAS
jgi:diaminohydroxyphosphoribosylaminopyrimidine deaminase/5-amino-6-(5-phosphoribosylamino)uracil reductase